MYFKEYPNTKTNIISCLSFSILTISISIAVPALALKHYINCLIRAANRDGELSEDEVNSCYYMVLVGARKDYANESSPTFVV
ncbi:MAG TPA: hypothetical protein VH500_18140 [Nitrososphaeraceae archaeon]